MCESKIKAHEHDFFAKGSSSFYFQSSFGIMMDVSQMDGSTGQIHSKKIMEIQTRSLWMAKFHVVVMDLWWFMGTVSMAVSA